MRNKFILLLFLITFSIIYSETPNYEGTWASNSQLSTTIQSTFLSITKFSENQYLVTSVSNRMDILTYIGGGYVNENGYLVVSTDQGDTWIFSEVFSSRYDEVISISDANMNEGYEDYYRLHDKFKTWPFDNLTVEK